MAENNYVARIKKLGIPDHYVEQGTIAELHHECGYDEEGIIAAVKRMLDTPIS
jgi:1-deoxy-D-xylulose-5-phosphate synthase